MNQYIDRVQVLINDLFEKNLTTEAAQDLIESLGKGIAIIVGNIQDPQRSNEVLDMIFREIVNDVERVKATRQAATAAAPSSFYIGEAANGTTH